MHSGLGRWCFNWTTVKLCFMDTSLFQTVCSVPREIKPLHFLLVQPVYYIHPVNMDTFYGHVTPCPYWQVLTVCCCSGTNFNLVSWQFGNSQCNSLPKGFLLGSLTEHWPSVTTSKWPMTVVYVAVKFLSQVIFLFLLFLGMVMYANEVETKEK